MFQKLLNKTVTFSEKNKFLLILLFVFFLIRLPSLYEPFWYGDEAIYAVIGQKILRGGLLYQDIFDHKTPGIYYLTASSLALFGQTIWSLRFVLMVWVLLSLAVYFTLSRRLFEEKIAKLSTLVLGLLLATPLIEGNIFNSEILMILPVSLGFIFGLRRQFFILGIFFSLAFLLKFPAIFDFAAFFLFLSLGLSKKNYQEIISNLVKIVLGFISPLALTVIYFTFKGAFSAYLFSALLFNFSYTNYGNKFQLAGFEIANGLIILKALPILALGIYFLKRVFDNFKNTNQQPEQNYLELTILWLAFSYYGAVFGGRPYPHYLIQAAPAFSILVSLIFLSRHFRKIALISTGLIIGLTLLLGFKPYIKPNYYPNFFRYFTNNISQEEYLNSFDAKTERNYSLSSFVKNKTTEEDNIFLWGNSPVIYFLSQRDPTSKYITAFHVTGNASFKEEVVKSVKERKPAYILLEETAPNFPELNNLILKQYNFFAQSDDIKIYERLGSRETD